MSDAPINSLTCSAKSKFMYNQKTKLNCSSWKNVPQLLNRQSSAYKNNVHEPEQF